MSYPIDKEIQCKYAADDFVKLFVQSGELTVKIKEADKLTAILLNRAKIQELIEYLEKAKEYVE